VAGLAPINMFRHTDIIMKNLTREVGYQGYCLNKQIGCKQDSKKIKIWLFDTLCGIEKIKSKRPCQANYEKG
jgi:hypothetical protein